jgi:hypothetical protein
MTAAELLAYAIRNVVRGRALLKRILETGAVTPPDMRIDGGFHWYTQSCGMAINVAIDNDVNWCIMCDNRRLKFAIIPFRSGAGPS